MIRKNYLKIITGIAVLITIAVGTVTAAARKLSWGDKEKEGVRESTSSELYNPARYAFDGNETTYWTAAYEKEYVWAEKYSEKEIDVESVEITAEISRGSKICFSYEKDGIWIPIENGIVEGPLYGKTNIEFTEEQRKTKRILVTFECEGNKTDRIYEIKLNKKESSRSWGKIEPEKYSFNQEEYINLKPSRLWDGYVKENWYEPLWYVQYEIQQTKEYKSGIFAPYNGNPSKSGEIIWELDGKYRIDLIKAYFDAGWRNIAFEFWDGEKWNGKKEFKEGNKTGWNRLEVNNNFETDKIRITFPSGWENARFINQIEIWGEGERKNEVTNILFTELSESNEYSATLERAENNTEIEIITEGNEGKSETIKVYINGNEYNLSKAELKTGKENIYRVEIKEEDKRKSIQYLKIKTEGKKLKNILIRENIHKDGRINTGNQYSDRDKGSISDTEKSEYEKKISLDRKYEIEKVIIYSKNGNRLRIRGNDRFGNYKDLLEEKEGVWSVELNGLETNELNIISDYKFEIAEAEIYGSPTEDLGCAVEIWSSEKNADMNSCIVGWKGSRESQIVIDGNIYPRQEGSLFWMPVREIRGTYLEKERHEVLCREGTKSSEKKYYVNAQDDTKKLLEEIKKTPLLLTIDIPYGEMLSQREEIEISGRYGNGNKIKIYVNGKETENQNGKYKAEVQLSEGENLINVIAEDTTGRKTERSITIIRDSIAPVIEILSPYEGEYINRGKAEFCIDGKTDSELWWRFNDEEWESGKGRIKYKDYYLEDGFYTYTVSAQDRSGNISTLNTVDFCMDKTAPESFDIEMNVDGWTNNNQPTAVFETTDITSGIDHYEYKIDEGIWKKCISPLTIEKLSDGVRKLYIRAIDKAGNIREEKAEIYVDTSKPPVPSNARPVSSSESLIVKWNGEDDNSIVNEKIVIQEGNRSYKIERNPEWKDGEKLLKDYGYGDLCFEDKEVEVGQSYAYRIYAIDRAGNKSEKTEWKSAIAGLAAVEIEKDKDTVVEYDGMTITIPQGSTRKDIVRIQINSVNDDLIDEKPVNPVVGSTYMVTAVRQENGELYVTEHADLLKPAVIEVTYKPSLIPEDYLNSEIAPYYYDDIWDCWMRMPESYINTDNHTVLFRTDHFTNFNVQATKKAVLTESEIRAKACKLDGENIGPAEVNISGESGEVSYEFVEYIMHGKGDLNLPIQRSYTTVKAKEDSSENDGNQVQEKIDGESVWNIADGWKINMPYMKVNGDNIVINGISGQCFSMSQMKTVESGNFNSGPEADSDINYHILMESHEYDDVRAELFFKKYKETDWVSTVLSLGIFGKIKHTEYDFKGAVLYQSDGKKVRFGSDGRVRSIEDCTGKNKITFEYDKSIIIKDSLDNKVILERKDNAINKIIINDEVVEYEKKNKELVKAKDICGREWNYQYKEKSLINKCELIEPKLVYEKDEPETYEVKVLTGIKGKGIGYTEIEYEVINDLVYEDTITSYGTDYTFKITQSKLYAKKKTESLKENEALRTTVYTVEYAGPEENQFYISRSVVDDGNVKTETDYATVQKQRYRISNAPEAIRRNWDNTAQTGDQEKNTKQVLTYSSNINTVSEKYKQTVTNEIDSSLMKLKKITTTKGKGNTITDVYEYYSKENDSTKEKIINGNVIKESHEYTTDGRKSSIAIEREYCEPVNNRTNLVSKMVKTACGFIEEESKQNTTEETYEYNNYGQIIKRNLEGNIWSYTYNSEGLLESETSPENLITEYTYDYTKDDEYTVTTRYKAKEDGEDIVSIKSYDRKNGVLKRETDADGYVTEYEYDVLGRMTSQKKNGSLSIIHYSYNDEELKTTETDELGCVTENQFDNLGRLVKVSKQAEKKISVLLEYDEYDRVIKMSEYYNDTGANVTVDSLPHSEYEYDKLGRITKSTDAASKWTEYSYDDSLNMVEVNKGGLEKTRIYKDNLGNIIRQENWISGNEWTETKAWYDGEGKLICSEDEKKDRTFIEYNNLGLLDSIKYPDGLNEKRDYDKDGLLNSIIRSQEGKTLSKEIYVYDDFGRVKEKQSFIEPENDERKKVIDAYVYNGRGLVTEESVYYEGDSDDIRTVKKEYDWNGNITKETDGEGNITEYQYDAKGNLLRYIDPRQYNAEYDGEFFMAMEYDGFGRLVKGWIPHTDKRADFDLVTTPADVVIEYDAKGNVINRTDKADENNSVKKHYEYYSDGSLESESCDGWKTTYEYDNAGRNIKITAPDGLVTQRVYDGSGRLLSENLENEEKSIKYTYNPTGTIKTVTDKEGYVTEYEYDSMNRTKTVKTANLTKNFTYDGLGRKKTENDGENNLREYFYDGLGRLTKEETPDGITLEYEYDARGNLTEYTDGLKTKFVRKYSKNDLLLEEKVYSIQQSSNYSDIPDEIRTYEYDEAGLLKSISDSSGTVFYNNNGKYNSDPYGNIRSMEWSSTGLEMKYDYDLLGRKTKVTNPDGKEINYTYNQNSQIISMDDFVNSISYETKNRLASYVLMNGITKTFDYNDQGNISSMKYSAENVNTGFSYIYDRNNNITSRTSLDTNKTSYFEYDKDNRLIRSEMNGAFEAKANLEDGNLARIDSDLDGKKEAETFLDVIPQEIILDAAARSFVYDFKKDTVINRLELYPDSSIHRMRERDIRIYFKSSENSEWMENQNWKFEKDESNGSLKFILKESVEARYIKIKSIWDDRDFSNKSIESFSTFKGNPQNLLRIWILEENQTEEYTYDGNSNRIEIRENGVDRSYMYYKNINNGNTERVMYDGKWWYTYDDNGNRTIRASNAENKNNKITIDKNSEYWEYTWDLWNRLIKAEQHNAPDGATNVCVEYKYDALNFRIERISNTESIPQTCQYAYDLNGALIYQKEISRGAETTRSYAYFNNQMVGWIERESNTEQKYYTVTDIQGSVTEIYDERGSLVWKSGYTAFGIKAGESTNFIDFNGLYTGCDYDEETGLTYHWNRWQSEDGSSWLTQDSARDGNNWYGYCGQNPLTFIDTDGKMAYSVQYNENYYGFSADKNTSREVLRKVYSFIPFVGDKIFTKFIKSYVGYTPIDNSGTNNLYSAVMNKASLPLEILGNSDKLVDVFNITGDFAEALKTIGTTISTLSNIALAGDIAITLNQSNSIAVDSIIDSLCGDVIFGSSHDDVSAIYYYAKERVNQLLKTGDIKGTRQKISGQVEQLEYNNENIEQLRTEIFILSNTSIGEMDNE